MLVRIWPERFSLLSALKVGMAVYSPGEKNKGERERKGIRREGDERCREGQRLGCEALCSSDSFKWHTIYSHKKQFPSISLYIITGVNHSVISWGQMAFVCLGYIQILNHQWISITEVCMAGPVCTAAVPWKLASGATPGNNLRAYFTSIIPFMYQRS